MDPGLGRLLPWARRRAIGWFGPKHCDWVRVGRDPSGGSGRECSPKALLVRLGCKTQVGLQSGEALREPHMGVIVRNGRRDDHVVAVLPVHRRGYGVLAAQLQCVEYPNDLVDVTTDGSRAPPLVFRRCRLTSRGWDSTESTLTPMSLVLRSANSSFRRAKSPSSVVHTGVKSAGWEKRMPHPSPRYSCRLTFPSVVSAVKSGAVSPNWIVIRVVPALISSTT